MDEQSWKNLVGYIKLGKCTPFLGAGACFGTLPTGSHIAKDWVGEDYPFGDKSDLAKVAQYLAVKQNDEMAPKFKIIKEIKNNIKEKKEKKIYPDFLKENEPHGVLSRLNLPLYITTNYDGMMAEALTTNKTTKSPITELCRWNESLDKIIPKSNFAKRDFKPTPEEPVVFHLHGHIDHAESIVITETDYLEFLIKMNEDDNLLPTFFRNALSMTALMFVGYSLEDFNFRVIFRGLNQNMGRKNQYPTISVQLLPENKKDEEKIDTQKFLNDYFSRIFDKFSIQIYWGDAESFSQTLNDKWVQYKDE
jgi:hypothetical protein